jgi:hypothetical protein
VCAVFLTVCFAWIFFRANTIHDALLIISKLTELPSELAGYVRGLSELGVVGTVQAAFQLEGAIAGFNLIQFGLSGIFMGILILSDIWTKETPGVTRIMKKPLLVRWAGYCILMMIILLNWNAGSSQFIYLTF